MKEEREGQIEKAAALQKVWSILENVRAPERLLLFQENGTPFLTTGCRSASESDMFNGEMSLGNSGRPPNLSERFKQQLKSPRTSQGWVF